MSSDKTELDFAVILRELGRAIRALYAVDPDRATAYVIGATTSVNGYRQAIEREGRG